QQLDEGHGGAGLAGAGRHDEQGAAALLLLEALTDPLNGLELVRAARDALVDVGRLQGEPAGALPNHPVQLVLGAEALDPAGRVTPVPVLDVLAPAPLIPQVGLVTV